VPISVSRLMLERDLAAEVAFHPTLELLGDDVTQLADLSVAQVLGAGIGRDTGERTAFALRWLGQSHRCR